MGGPGRRGDRGYGARACEPASPLEGSLTLLTPEVGGDGAAGGVIDAPGFSADGKTMKFTSLAGDELEGYERHLRRLCATGRRAGTPRVGEQRGHPDGGRGPGSSWSGDAVIDLAGRYVAFTSYATDSALPTPIRARTSTCVTS